MPKATDEYPFEWKVFEFAGKLSATLTGSPYHTFLLIFHQDGAAQSLIFQQPDQLLPDRIQDLVSSGVPHLFYDPFDAPEHGYLSWKEIEQTTMERLIGQSFEAADFKSFRNKPNRTPLNPPDTFPVSWGVMF